MVSGPTTFPESRLRIPNQPALDSQLAAKLSPQLRYFLSNRVFTPCRAGISLSQRVVSAPIAPVAVISRTANLRHLFRKG